VEGGPEAVRKWRFKKESLQEKVDKGPKHMLENLISEETKGPNQKLGEGSVTNKKKGDDRTRKTEDVPHWSI